MRMFASIARLVRRVRLAVEEQELAFMEAMAPTALARQRDTVARLRARVHADKVIVSADQICRRIERQVKKTGVLA